MKALDEGIVKILLFIFQEYKDELFEYIDRKVLETETPIDDFVAENTNSMHAIDVRILIEDLHPIGTTVLIGIQVRK